MLAEPPGTLNDLQLDWVIAPAVMRGADVMLLAAAALAPNGGGPRGAFAGQVIVETADLTRRLVERPEYVRCVCCERPFGRGGAAAFLIGVPAAGAKVWPLCEACAAHDDGETIRQADAALARAYHSAE